MPNGICLSDSQVFTQALQMRKRYKDRLSQFELEERKRQAISEQLKRLDQIAREMEQSWGIGRLANLVDPNLAEKFQRAISNVNIAIQEENVPMLIQKIDNAVKGWKLLDLKARANGHTPQDQMHPQVWYWAGENGLKIGIVMKEDDLKRIPHGACDRTYTLEEVCQIISSWEKESDIGQSATMVKQTFKGSKIIELRTKDNNKKDGIPF